MLVILFTLALVCIELTVGDEACRVRGNLTNELKCGDNVYTRSQAYIDVAKLCTVGKQGELITNEITVCMVKNYKVPEGSELSVEDVVKRDIRTDFGVHAEQHIEGFLSCYLQFKDESPQSTKFHDCLYRSFERICGTKSCNFINNYLGNDA